MATSSPLSPSLIRRMRAQRAADLAELRDAAGDAFPLARFIPAAPAAPVDHNSFEKAPCATPAGRWIASRDADAWRTMAADLHAAAMLHAVRHAARGRMIGERARKDAPTADAPVAIPAPHWIEDLETATDAVAFVWNAVREGRVQGDPLPFLCTVARRLGVRRAQNRLRERSGLAPDATDRIVPPEAMHLDAEALARATAGTLRAEFGARFVRPATDAERKRAQARARKQRQRTAAPTDAELETLRARNARPDAIDEPPNAAMLFEAARERATDDERERERARAHRLWFETMRAAYEADAILRFGPMPPMRAR